MTPNPIDRAQRLIHALGWSFGDWWVDGTSTVYANRDAGARDPIRDVFASFAGQN